MSNTDKKNKLEDELDKIQSSYSNLNVQHYSANKDEHMPNFGDLEIYDYNKDIVEVEKEASQYMQSLSSMYLGDSQELLNHDYIIRKVKEDARIYADSLFLDRMSKKVLLQQLKLVDNDGSPRQFEIINQTFKEIRENNKDGRNSRSEIEKLYKDIRADFGLNHISESNKISDITPIEADDDSQIINTIDLNNKINDYLTKKE